jgi:zinc protease
MQKRWRGAAMSIFVAAAVAASASCGAVLKPPRPDQRLNVHVSGGVFEAGNGYRFVAIPEPAATVIQVDVRYPVGSADDPVGKEGLAHLVEHLLFDVEITRNGATTSIGAELGRLALSWNAFTYEDATVYQTTVVPGALDALLALEVDRLAVGCIGLNEEIFAREREVVMNELRSRQGASGAGLLRAVEGAVYPAGHPYARVGSVETVAKLTLDDVCKFLAGPYQRDKASVIASGAIEPAALQAAAGNHYGKLDNRVLKKRTLPAPVAPNPGAVRLTADIEDPMLVATWPLPPLASREYRMLEFVWPHIEGRVAGLAFRDGWGHSTSTTVLGGAYAPVLAVSVQLTSTKDFDNARDAIIDAIGEAYKVVYYNSDDTRDSYAWSLQWHYRAEAMLADWASLDGRNTMFGDFLQYEPDDTGYLIGRIEELTKAEPKEVRALAETWITPERARYLWIEPSGAKELARVKTFAGGAAEHGVRVDPALADTPLPLPSESLAIETVRYTTGNGMQVVMWPNAEQPLVEARLVVDSGWGHDPAGAEGVAQMAGAATLADTLVYDRRELATEVDTAIKVLGFELRSPGYEPSDDAKKFYKAALRRKRVTERRTYESDLAVALYGKGHPYARSGMTEDSLDEIHRDLVIGWARDHVVPKNAVLVIAGKFDPELAKKHIAYNTDQVSAGSDSKDLEAAMRTSEHWVRGTEAKASPTVELDVLYGTSGGLGHDHAKRLVLESVLDSMLEELRGKHAVTYGISSSFSPRRAGGVWRISGEVDAARAGEAATLVVETLATIRDDRESIRTAFVLARQKVLEGLLVSTGDPAAVAERLVQLARFDLADDFYDGVARDVAAMTLTDFHTFVTTELGDEHRVFGAFGNADAVDAAIKAAQATE